MKIHVQIGSADVLLGYPESKVRVGVGVTLGFRMKKNKVGRDMETGEDAVHS